MPKTLFVVDDSVTMRKVFELTFGGEDVTLVTHDGSDGVLNRAREVRPAAFVIDTVLASGSGYDLCRAIKGDAALSGAQVLLLASEHTPLDEARARESGSDGSLMKPFDTQATIDRVKQAFGGPAPVASPGQRVQSTSLIAGGPGAPPAGQRAVPVAAAVPPAMPPLASAAAARAKSTQMFGGGFTPPPSPSRPGPPPVPVRPSTQMDDPMGDLDDELPLQPASAPSLSRPSPYSAPSQPAVTRPPATSGFGTAPPASTTISPAPFAPVQPREAASPGPSFGSPAPAPSSASSPMASASAEVEQRVAGLGLTPAQVAAVTALTREVVERVVWEVVPQLAETMIREEIRRLTAE